MKEVIISTKKEFKNLVTGYLESSIRVASKVFDAINDCPFFNDWVECLAPCLWKGVFSNEDEAEEYAEELACQMRRAGIPADEYEFFIC